jgi:hypothetical protein
LHVFEALAQVASAMLHVQAAEPAADAEPATQARQLAVDRVAEPIAVKEYVLTGHSAPQPAVL